MAGMNWNFHQIPQTPLTIPFFCHTGLEDWPKQANARSKSVKKKPKSWKIHFFDPYFKIRLWIKEKGLKIYSKGHISPSYSPPKPTWGFWGNFWGVTEKISHLGWNYSYVFTILLKLCRIITLARVELFSKFKNPKSCTLTGLNL